MITKSLRNIFRQVAFLIDVCGMELPTVEEAVDYFSHTHTGLYQNICM